jgi:hypothetical protein
MMAGYRVAAQLMIIGIDAARKAQRTGEALIERGRALLGRLGYGDFSATSVELLGTESVYGPHATAAATREVILRVAVTHKDKRALEVFAREFAAPGTSWSPGTTGAGSGRPSVSPVLRQFAFLLDKSRVAAQVRFDDRCEDIPIPEVAPQTEATSLPEPPSAAPDAGPTVEVQLISIAYGRSGDKGDTSNIGLMARRPEWLPLIRSQVTPERVAEYLAHLVKGPIRRYDLPGINAVNLVCEQALGGGGMASLRNDPLGKGMAQILLGMPVRVPANLF